MKPFLETEANYEDIWTVKTVDTRQAAWKALQCGSYGYTYGVAGVWGMKWDYDVPGWDNFQNGIPWFDGLNRPGGTQMTYLKEFYLGLPDWQLQVPRFGDPAYGTFDNPERSVLTTDGSSTYVVYFYDSTLETGVFVGLDDDKTYTARWFDPRTGAYLKVEGPVLPSGGTWVVPSKPSTEDWTLVVSS